MHGLMNTCYGGNVVEVEMFCYVYIVILIINLEQ